MIKTFRLIDIVVKFIRLEADEENITSDSLVSSSECFEV